VHKPPSQLNFQPSHLWLCVPPYQVAGHEQRHREHLRVVRLGDARRAEPLGVEQQDARAVDGGHHASVAQRQGLTSRSRFTSILIFAHTVPSVPVHSYTLGASTSLAWPIVPWPGESFAWWLNFSVSEMIS